jgi:hypothetical protein
MVESRWILRPLTARAFAGLAICLLSCNIAAVAQGTGEDVRPELDLYIQQGPLLRFEISDSFSGDQSTHNWQGNFAFYVETALKPVLRRELRDQPDVYRNKYLTLRAGYRYQNSLTAGHSAAENRGIIELTSRYELPGQLVVTDRSRGEFRFIEGISPSTRYRNRLRLERDLTYGWLESTPYIYDEIFYDTRYGLWSPNRYGVGVQFQVGRHTVLEPQYFRQDGSRSNPANLNVFVLILNIYLAEQ